MEAKAKSEMPSWLQTSLEFILLIPKEVMSGKEYLTCLREKRK